MINSFDSLMRTLRILCVGMLLAGIFILVSVLANTPETKTVQAEAATPSSRQKTRPIADSPNAVANSMAVLSFEINKFADSTATTSARVMNRVAVGTKNGAIATAKTIRSATMTTGRGIATGAQFVGRSIGSGVSFVIKIPGKVIGSVSQAPIIGGFIRPADHIEDVPIIDPNSPELRAALTALPAEKKTDPKSSKGGEGPAWPIRGQITTHFGVDHWPYQHTHTGMDISDGRAPGVTPVKPFRSGRVIETISSYYGLGNHVIVDHGNGVTSVYAHLASISVTVGQQVGIGTTLGHEGSTGASTGTHLHFEIRVNGKAADPRQFISGTP